MPWSGGPQHCLTIWGVAAPAARATATRIVRHRTSNTPAAPMPPPMHMVTTTLLRAAALAFDQRMADEALARHAVGVAHGDGAAVDVEAIARNAQLVAAVDHLHGEGFVEFPQVDVARP